MGQKRAQQVGHQKPARQDQDQTAGQGAQGAQLGQGDDKTYGLAAPRYWLDHGQEPLAAQGDLPEGQPNACAHREDVFQPGMQYNPGGIDDQEVAFDQPR